MRWLITAGPTHEPLDAVRFIGNRSSGRVGLAVAQAAARADDVEAVTLLLGPVDSSVAAAVPKGVSVERFKTADDLQRLLTQHWSGHDVLVMAAAVADYRLAMVTHGKLPRMDPGESVRITLTPTPDIVAGLAKTKKAAQHIIGFALEEPACLRQRALVKMRRKGLDAIIANPLETMDAEQITPTWFGSDGSEDSPGTLAKLEFGNWLVQHVREMASEQAG